MKFLLLACLTAFSVAGIAQADTGEAKKLEDSIYVLQEKLDTLEQLYKRKYIPQKKETYLQQLFKGLSIRQSFGSEEARREPAKFQFTVPKNDKNSFLIDGAIGAPLFSDMTIFQTWRMSGKLVGEYHRNNQVDLEQFNWQLGYSSALRTKLRTNSNDTRTSFHFSPTAKFTRNVIDSVSAIVFVTDFSLFRSGSKGLNFNTYTFSKNKRLIHLASLSPSFEYQNNFVAKYEILEGAILRPVLKAQYSLFGNKRRPGEAMIVPVKTFAVFIDYTARYDAVNTTGIREKFTDQLVTGADYYLLSKPIEVTLGFSFNYGSNPLEGLPKQQFWLFTLSIQK